MSTLNILLCLYVNTTDVDKPEVKSTSRVNEKVHSYSLEFKITAIASAELHNSNRGAARKFKAEPKRIRDWGKAKESIISKKDTTVGTKRKRLDGGGRKPKDIALEEDLMEWITERCASKLRVSQKLIMFKARSMHKESVGRRH